jgi:hypothetical protein
MECDYRRGLDWWPDLLDSLIQRVTTLYSSLLHTHTSVHSHVFTVVAWLRLPTATEPLPNNGRCFQSHTLATSVSAGFTIPPSANVPQYCSSETHLPDDRVSKSRRPQCARFHWRSTALLPGAAKWKFSKAVTFVMDFLIGFLFGPKGEGDVPSTRRALFELRGITTPKECPLRFNFELSWVPEMGVDSAWFQSASVQGLKKWQLSSSSAILLGINSWAYNVIIFFPFVLANPLPCYTELERVRYFGTGASS